MSKLTDLIDNREAVNAAVVATVQPVSHLISGMKALMPKAWPAMAGTRPSDALLTAAAVFSKRGLQGGAGCEAGFVALQLRPEGATLQQLAVAFNAGPAHNHTRALADGAGGKGGLHYFVRAKAGTGVFTLTFTDKGTKQLAALMAQATGAADVPAKAPAKAKRARKPKPATQAPAADTPASDAPEVTGGQVADVPAPVGDAVDAAHA
jgi:hypothetical protein